MPSRRKASCRVPPPVTLLPSSPTTAASARATAVDLFAGAGGLSLGFRTAGFEVLQAIEIDRHASATYRRNHTTTDFREEDICELDPRACMRSIGIRPRDLTVLIAGLPCQGFSESNRRTRTLENPRNHLYSEFVRFLGAMRPQWFVVENVAGMRTLCGGTILDALARECEALGYEVAWRQLCAADYGVPQLRRRLFVIGNRLSHPVPFPQPTHRPTGTRYVTVRGAIGDLSPLVNGAAVDWLPYPPNAGKLGPYQKLMRKSHSDTAQVQGNLVSSNCSKVVRRYRHIKSGQNWEVVPRRLLDNYADPSRCHTGIYHRLDWDKPAKVIGNFRKNMLIHPGQDRGLSVREAARLQSFPDTYIFVGSIGFQQQQVADAVPPLLAEAVAHCILSTSRTSHAKILVAKSPENERDAGIRSPQSTHRDLHSARRREPKP